MKSAIEVQGLSKSFGTLQAVQDISFRVGPGETVVLLGPNGSGKTTTLHCVAGLLRPDRGVVRVNGFDLRRQYRRARSQFSFLPQLASFAPQLSVHEVLQFHARLRGVAADRVDAALELAGFSAEDLDRSVGELSGGLRQRLSLAVAGMPSVAVMVLDEPTANLDPEAALRFRELAQHWRDSGRALLLSTHVLDDVQELADRVVVLVGGQAVVEESISELRARLRSFALLRVDVGTPSDAHIRAALDSGASEARCNSRSVIITAPEERRYEILTRLGELGPIYHFETEEPTLEHIYIDYVQRPAAEQA